MFAGALILLDISQANAWFFCLLFGLGYGGVTVTTRLVLVEMFGLRGLVKLLGVTMGVELIFSSGGNLLTGRLFDATGGYQTAFKVMAVCSLVSVISMALLRLKEPVRARRMAVEIEGRDVAHRKDSQPGMTNGA